MATRKQQEEQAAAEARDEAAAAMMSDPRMEAVPIPPSGSGGMNPQPQIWDASKSRKQNKDALSGG